MRKKVHSCKGRGRQVWVLKLELTGTSVIIHNQFINQMGSATCSPHLTHFFKLESVLSLSLLKRCLYELAVQGWGKWQQIHRNKLPYTDKQYWTDNINFKLVAYWHLVNVWWQEIDPGARNSGHKSWCVTNIWKMYVTKQQIGVIKVSFLIFFLMTKWRMSGHVFFSTQEILRNRQN